MESWISQRIRAVSLRRLIAWNLALVAGVLLATSDHRYIINFMRGPYPLARADLDSIQDIETTPRYYARVAGDKVLDTGIRQYTVHTRAGVETSREESGAYHALVVGNRFLVVRTAGYESNVAEGRLAPWPSELDGQLFDSKEMESLRANFYPFYMEAGSFRRPGYVVIAIAILFLLLFAWQVVPALRALRDPEQHKLARRIAAWGDPLAVAVEAEREFNHSMLRSGGWRLGEKYLVHSRFFTFDVLRLQDLLWGYKKITKHSVNFIPTGKSYEAILACAGGGGTATISGKEKKVDEILSFASKRVPWAIFGFSQELQGAFTKQQQEFATTVEERRREWAQKTGRQ
jgi:hypothetical protein